MAIAKTIDIDNEPQLIEIISALRDERSSVHLRLAGEEVAIVTPILAPSHDRPVRRIETEEDLAEFLNLAGGWADVDTDQLIDDLYRQRLISTRPSVDL